mmetsp:Transcript_30887/g.22455  ORF Transcript_30887/g.22455 Transcript_30887/m.22455 type:complete len:252 (+) Transcript_30887:300-1055(+)
MLIAKINQRTRILELSILKEILYSNWIIVVSVLDNSLNFFHVVHASTGFDILEVDVLVISVRQNIAQEVQKTVVGSKAFEDFDTLLGINFAAILDSNLGTEHTIGSVNTKQVVHRSEAIFLAKVSKSINHFILRDSMSVHHDTLSVSDLSVVRESSSEKIDMLAKLCNTLSIILSESIELENTLSYIRSTHQVNLEKFSLQVSLIRSVVLESFKQEGSSFLDAVIINENLNNTIKRSLWHASCVTNSDHLG